jgi:hypothetical protein
MEDTLTNNIAALLHKRPVVLFRHTGFCMYNVLNIMYYKHFYEIIRINKVKVKGDYPDARDWGM